MSMAGTSTRTARRVVRAATRSFDTSSESGRANERHRRVVLAAAMSVAARVISTLVFFVAVRLVASSLTADALGLWLLLVTGVTLVGFADLGVGNGLLNAAAESHGRGDEALLREVIASAFAALLVLATALGAVFVLVYPLIPWSRVLNTHGLIGHQVGPAVAVAVTCTLLSMPLGVAQRVHLARQEGWIAGLWVGIGGLLSLTGVAVASASGAGLPVLVGVMLGGLPAAYLLETIALFAVTDRPLRPTFANASPNAAVRIVHQGALFFVLASAVAIGYESDSVVVSHYLGSAAVATYAVPFRLFMLAPMVVTLLVTPLWPAYGEAVARGDLQWVHRTLRRSLVVALGSTIVSSLVLLPLAKPLIARWTSGAVRPSTSFLVIVAAWAVLAGVSAALGAFFNGVGALRFQAIAASSMALANIALSIFLVRRHGVSGPILATLLTQTACILAPSAIIMRGLFARGAGPGALRAWITRWRRPAQLASVGGFVATNE